VSNAEARPIIIVKRRKAGGGGHHGGAWKVAYADFVTAMMAFFMVMWLVASVSDDKRAAMFEYFRNPSMEQGKSSKPAPGQQGPGGASTSVIRLGGGMDSPRSSMGLTPNSMSQPIELDRSKAEEAAKLERKRLEALMQELKEAINNSQALEPFKDQLLLDIMPEGLRIQIVDAQNRPMFNLGSARLQDYTSAILKELSSYLNSVPNRITIAGHTDVTPYVNPHGYTNWELSADRANAARRALIDGGLEQEKIGRVVGMGSVALFDRENARNPINRRISIIVMTKQADDESLKMDLPTREVMSSSDGSAASEAHAMSPEQSAAALATTDPFGLPDPMIH
jgi:chemotaxis protein MotB